MKLFYEDENKTLYIKKTATITKRRLNSAIDKIDNLIMKDQAVFLLDESRFLYFSFENTYDLDDKINIHFINDLIREKENYLFEEHGIVGKQLFYNIDDIYVDGERKEYLIGNKGAINFRLNIVYMKIEDYYIFKGSLGSDIFENKNVNIFPKSFFTINYIKNRLGLKNVNLMYLGQNSLKLIQLKDGFYDLIDEIDLGFNKLKAIFKDDSILGLYYDSYMNKEISEFSVKLIKDSLSFYSKMIVNWFNINISSKKDVLIISNVLKNKYFMEIFSKEYFLKEQGSLLPLHFPDHLDKFGKKWNYNEVDILFYLNSK